MKQSVKNRITTLPKAYSSILFLQNPVPGLIIIACTLYHPNIGLSGLLAAGVSLLVIRLWQFPDYAGQVQLFNSMLVGLSLGAFYQLNIYIIGIIVLGSVLTTIIAAVLADWLWRLDRLPAMSLPFVLVAAIMALVARHYTGLSDFLGLAQTSKTLFTPAIDTFFATIGAMYFTPEPVIGLLLFGLLLLHSRFLAMLAILGFIVGYSMLSTLLFEPHPGFLVWTSFNFILVAMALGGIFTIPGVASLLLAAVGVLLSVLLVVAMQNLILVEGLPVMAMPFVVTTLLTIIAMKKRIGILKPYLATEPGLPEINYEKARLARYRSGELNSVPLLAPVFGTWSIYQGFNGKHTHKPPWQYALDFFITTENKSYHGNGDKLENFYCYAAPVLSPAHGEVVRVYDRFPDNTPGDVDAKNNWGNFVLLRLDSGLHLLLAHLQQGSVKVREGTRVQPGKLLASCGNSGRSPQPHLHLQVQRNAELGSDTFPFHLCSLMLRKTNGSLEYKVVSVPEEGEQIEPTIPDDQLAQQLHLPVGRQLNYRLSCNHSDVVTNQLLTVQLTLMGQFRLVSESHASAAFEESNGVLAFYDRKGPKDILLDLWILANGLTPLTEIARQWRDSPSAKLLPIRLADRFFLNIFRPLGCGLDSEYRREWDDKQKSWMQNGSHALKLGSTIKVAETVSCIDPAIGCKKLTMHFEGKTWQAELSETGLVEDEGIPQWSKPTGFGKHYDYNPSH